MSSSSTTTGTKEAITGQQSPEKGDLLDKEEKSPDADRPNMKLRIVLLSTTGAAGNSILKRKALTSKFIRRRITVIGTTCRSETEQDMRVELLHRTLILGKTDAEEKLKSECNLISVRNPSETDRSTVEGRNVSVIDTPRSSDPAVKPADLAQEMTRVFQLCSPGPHAVLFVVSLSDSFTEEDEAMIKSVEKFYGKDMADYTILVLTHSDPEEVEEFIRQDKDLNRLVQQCGGRYHMFNNKDENNRDQVTELLQKIDTMIQQNGGSCDTNDMFLEEQGFNQAVTKKSELSVQMTDFRVHVEH